MGLAVIDWVIIIAFLAISLGIGVSLKSKANSSLSDFFLGGRNLPWYIAGMSMVATTFAADTPLWVTEVVSQNGISGNWLWWNMLIGGMLTTFFFSRLWRRADILTELEFIELRYSGPAAKFLRGFKSVYMGIFLNAVVIGWVNVALMTIISVFFGITDQNQLLLCMAIAMTVVVIYSSISGLLGVAITDVMQFIIAMVGCIVLAFYVVNSPEIGGIDGLKEKLPEWQLSFFPSIGSAAEAGSTFSLTIGAFLSFSLVQWWSAWYPGAEPGGGGYISQRMMSTKNEKHSIYATLFFQIAHYCLRPWPWILVGLCAVVLYPDLPPSETKNGFVYIMRDYLPAGLKGLLLVTFLGAYMSTISTQLNWGASYLTNDLYKRFIKKEEVFENELVAQKHYVKMAKFFTVLIMVISLVVTTQITTIDGAAKFLIACGAGLGLVLILRWYWWRINAWSEISATIAPFLAYSVCTFVLKWEHTQTFLTTTLFTTIVWIVVTYFTRPTDSKTLLNFYNKVRPDGNWKGVAENLKTSQPEKGNLGLLSICWISSIVMTYSCLFLIGKVIFKEWLEAGIWLFVAVISLIILTRTLNKTKIFDKTVE